MALVLDPARVSDFNKYIFGSGHLNQMDVQACLGPLILLNIIPRLAYCYTHNFESKNRPGNVHGNIHG